MTLFAAYPLSEKLSLLAASVGGILPEIILTVFFLLAIVLELTVGKRSRAAVPATAFLGILVAALAVILLWENPIVKTATTPEGIFLGMVQPDGFAGFFKLLGSLAALVTIAISFRSNRLREEARGMGEYYLILLAMVIGMYFMSMARNLLMVYLALELVSIPSYILTAYNRLSARSAEASLKYVIYGAFSSGIMLYGISWLYGMTGTLDMVDPAFAAGLAAAGQWPVTFALLLVLGGFAFKINALPFHFWSPDVYEGASYPVAAFFSVGPMAMGFAVLIRFVDALPTGESGLSFLQDNLQLILGLIAIASMIVGNFAALRQANFRRMLAYSGIGQSGYLLVGVIAMTQQGFGAVMFYLTIYFSMNFAAFVIAGWLEEEIGTGEMTDFKGLGNKLPLLTVVLTIVMVSLTGLPPTAGFIGKWKLFLAGFSAYADEGNIVLMATMITMLVTTVVSLFYYLRAPSLMVFANPVIKAPLRLQGFTRALLVGMAIPLVLLGIFFFDDLINFLNGLTLH
ncbi:MAG: NADH-quinone oxidoreductase subunit N [Bacteroidota bacterium]